MRINWQIFAGGFVICIYIFVIANVLGEAACATINTISNPCNFQPMSDSGVCACNTTYCDTFDIPTIDCGEFLMVTSSKAGKRFHISKWQEFNSITSPVLPVRWLKIDRNRTFETVIGFGGALTDATSSLIDQMPRTIRHCAYNSYISPSFGAAYQIFRIPLGGSDFGDAPCMGIPRTAHQ